MLRAADAGIGSQMNHSILVIDDNPDHLELTVMALGECCDPKMIATATDGVEALDYLWGRGAFSSRDTSQQPRLIILDMKLVRMHGLDVLKALRQDPRTATVPVVMHSSSTEKGDIAACYANGANSYVRKATDYDELRRKMRQVHDFWLTVNERFRLA
jgi:CheY-like chemotaxis protein